MRLYEILTEDTSTEASHRNINDVLTVELPALYRELTSFAERYHANHGSLGKGFQFVAGGPKSRWYQEVFIKKMRPALYNLAKSLPRNVSGDLVEMLDTSIGGKSFGAIEEKMLSSLERIASDTKNKALASAVQAAKNAQSKYQSTLSKLETMGDEDQEDEYAAPKEKKPNVVSGQNVSAEAIINSVLSKIPKQHSGEIRNILAKSSNKLATLQQELNKRGIRV